MPNIDTHAPGSFCWFELGTSDQSAAKRFYGSLFGWASEDFPMGPGGVYTMFRLNGRDVGACYTLNEAQKAQSVPPHWNLYVAVENADAVAGRASELGAQIFMPPFDVVDAGRMTVMADPTGAVISIWQPKRHHGVGVTGVESTACWADLSTTDVNKAKDFYGALFGWSIKAGEQDSSGYLHIYNKGYAIGGIPPAEYHKPGVPPHWLVYYYVTGCAGSVTKARQLGANIYMDSQAIPNVGTMAIIADPQGAVFALFQPLAAA